MSGFSDDVKIAFAYFVELLERAQSCLNGMNCFYNDVHMLAEEKSFLIAPLKKGLDSFMREYRSSQKYYYYESYLESLTLLLEEEAELEDAVKKTMFFINEFEEKRRLILEGKANFDANLFLDKFNSCWNVGVKREDLEFKKETLSCESSEGFLQNLFKFYLNLHRFRQTELLSARLKIMFLEAILNKGDYKGNGFAVTCEVSCDLEIDSFFCTFKKALEISLKEFLVFERDKEVTDFDEKICAICELLSDEARKKESTFPDIVQETEDIIVFVQKIILNVQLSWMNEIFFYKKIKVCDFFRSIKKMIADKRDKLKEKVAEYEERYPVFLDCVPIQLSKIGRIARNFFNSTIDTIEEFFSNAKETVFKEAEKYEAISEFRSCCYLVSTLNKMIVDVESVEKKVEDCTINNLIKNLLSADMVRGRKALQKEVEKNIGYISSQANSLFCTLLAEQKEDKLIVKGSEGTQKDNSGVGKSQVTGSQSVIAKAFPQPPKKGNKRNNKSRKSKNSW